MRIFLTLITLLFFSGTCFAQIPGKIFDPALPATTTVPAAHPMDPNGDGFITSTGAAFTPGASDEAEFELPFIPVQQFEIEPGNDNQYGPGCEFYDLINDPASGAAAGYYYYNDPDGIPDNGDELIIFRFRVARFSSGSTGFSVLMDTDYKFGFAGPEADPNAVPGNPGFEREVAAYNSTGVSGGVRVYNVDGRDTASVIMHSASIHSNYQLAYALNQDPICSAHVPVFVDMFVPFSALGIASSTQIRMVVAVNEEPKTSLGGGASDIGGVNGYSIPDDDDQFIAAITNFFPIAAGDPVNRAPLAIDAGVFLDENTINGSSVHTVSASDPNGDILTYSITAGNTGSAFFIDAATGAITVNSTSALDAETTASFILVVRVSDGKLYDNAIVTINLNDVNEYPPLVSDAVVFLDENPANGALVHTVAATDADATTELTYSITAGNPGAIFVIDSNSGEIRVNDSSALDFETITSFVLTVGASDGSFFGDATVTINLNDVNESPSVEDTALAIEENTASGTVIYTVSGMDPDAGAVLTYSITSGNTGTAFAMNNSGEITVNDALALDFETTPFFTLTVRVSDGILFDDAIISVNIMDVNEPPLVEDGSVTIDRRLVDGDIVHTIRASDPDANDVLSFAIDGGNTDGFFTVDARTGDIGVQQAKKFNRSFRTHDLEVSATDLDGTKGWARIRITMDRKADLEDITPRKGFSPNGDGTNDFWLIDGIELFPDNMIQVFNRWGVPVYETQGYSNESNAWRGENKGADRVESTYFFIIKAGGFSPITGYVIVKP